MQNKNLIVNNLNINYLENGKGPTILFLHGWGTEAESFKKLIEEFGDNRCIALTFPGFGKSEIPNEAWGVARYAEFVKDFIKKLNIDPEIIIGHSFGGRVAIKGVSSGIFKPKKLILVASAGAAHKSFRTIFIGIAARVGKLVTLLPPFNLLRNRLRRMVSSSDYANAGEMRDIFIKVVNENLEKDASKINIPTLLVWGENDSETPLVEAKRLNDCIGGSRLVLIPNSGHFVFQDKAIEVAEEIRRFK